MSFSVRKTRFKFSLTRVNTSPNSGVRWWMMGSAPAAETSGGIGVGPGDIRRYLFIIDATSLTANNRTSILDTIVADGYILGHLFYKVLLLTLPALTLIQKLGSVASLAKRRDPDSLVRIRPVSWSAVKEYRYGWQSRTPRAGPG